MAQYLIPGDGVFDDAAGGLEVLLPGTGGVFNESESAGGDATANGATLTGTSSLTPGAASGSGSGSAPGATLTGTSSLTPGAASGSASFTSDVMINNTGSVLASTSIVWTWWQGSIGSTPTALTHGTGTTNASGVLTVAGMAAGAGFLLARTTDSSGVYYQPGTAA